MPRFSNTRSVAELVLGEILLLMRNIPQANADVHRGLWNKSAVGSHEVRGKKIRYRGLRPYWFAIKYYCGVSRDGSIFLRY